MMISTTQGEIPEGHVQPHEQEAVVCCGMCRPNEMWCLAQCRTDCVSSTVCQEAGKGAYAKCRESPYFFNAGLFNTGASLNRLGSFYAGAIMNSKLEFDVIFGPAYKGIPLAVATSIALYREYGVDAPYIINRKESKDHGEGGLLIGATSFLERPQCRVLIIDDVITAGTALREVASLLRPFKGCEIAGVVVALDREERLRDESPSETAVHLIAKEYSILQSCQ
ncbi:orotate phosphoribosyltransferase-like [Condylostylus longicornis]|uniref:orotate phosphoribosyltransferase-like n=1 Tax=Condylostylus longicornis TaxID=2530218 RepID=UPI00244E07D6|nr:orotate phosphoribosyltransferase-like [Condylostylus longicornis]